MDIFQERGHQADVKNNLSVEQLHGIVGNYDGMVIRSATKVSNEHGVLYKRSPDVRGYFSLDGSKTVVELFGLISEIFS